MELVIVGCLLISVIVIMVMIRIVDMHLPTRIILAEICCIGMPWVGNHISLVAGIFESWGLLGQGRVWDSITEV